jgi:4-hydroxybenzoate polyprenyltransferase
MRRDDLMKSLLSIGKATRAFSYGHYLVILFPFFALLLEYSRISPSEVILFLVPFVFAMASGFVYNTICDVEKDPKEKNPITRGDLSAKHAYLALFVFLLVAFVLIIFISQSIAVVLLFSFYMGIWFAYSGLRVRLKESVFGPIAASVVLWSGPSLILLVAFNYFSISAISLLFGLFMVYIGHEIKHTIMDHDSDLAHDCKSFAVILGKKRASVVEYASLIVGFLFLLAGGYFLPQDSDAGIALLFAVLFAAAIISTGLYTLKRNYQVPSVITRIAVLPYIVTKMLIITYGLVVLQLPLILVFFALWFYLL